MRAAGEVAVPEFCGTCKAPVVWALTPAGARAPIDPDPDAEKGNVLLLSPSGFGLLAVVLSKVALERARGQGVALRTNHWATCPDRAEWRERTDTKREERAGGAIEG